MCGPRLAAMEIMYEDQREDVTDRQLIVVTTRLTISPSIIDCIRQTPTIDEFPDQRFTQGTYSALVRDVYGLYRMRG